MQKTVREQASEQAQAPSLLHGIHDTAGYAL